MFEVRGNGVCAVRGIGVGEVGVGVGREVRLVGNVCVCGGGGGSPSCGGRGSLTSSMIP